MRTYDLPTLRRSTVGFEHLLNLVNDATVGDDNYPPFDVLRTGENQYRISLALPGFTPQEIAITAEQSALTVEGGKAEKEDGDYLHQGISMRPFCRVFNLSEHMKVKDATFDNGLLSILLVREVPEAMKPRRIAIVGTGNDNQKTENTQAA
ncbi:Hsp20 family protein [Bradyrhizobium sp. AUGA SZCCT0240]|jgi:molecular chaperone IbpA|uniref:Hsp20 family protein n=1 Tax=unclassified Bradyrhizobium TaxID=2631580 RepID=UPI001BABA80E|nr:MULTISPECIES: Hsp20 family protein [unclassified Bradyrhizobium]MBR1192092.1 Hsp20 family protein [Bradyrhizobium sp. AUGA SZCCT0160]MBR1194464.1 Hsp20 family protein [Bradyrhizobium sp. AUGA SZCCT0158]MBR1241309.1 Hsp20 family protein [Bradyrhizobium sp. AUGA SZCCT0274]MBR1249988.1 Hsp20 family protein [Bradyrhizobium sp. AUGA SZCCT0169]MBR1253506.1 Hsp20 family protein [Bradyrhizobium sp. AUGA SZCCT0240]